MVRRLPRDAAGPTHMSIIADQKKIDQHTKQFIRELKQAARSKGQRLTRKGTGYMVDRPIHVTTPLEGQATSQHVLLVEISAQNAAFTTNYYLAADTLVIMQLSGSAGIPARVTLCKRNGNQCRVELDFVREYDHEVYRLAEESAEEKKSQFKGLLAWLMD